MYLDKLIKLHNLYYEHQTRTLDGEIWVNADNIAYVAPYVTGDDVICSEVTLINDKKIIVSETAEEVAYFANAKERESDRIY